jgi:hypothetical protein
VSERLREQLQERLLVALDFATLGAYELTAPEGDAVLAENDLPTETAVGPAVDAPHPGGHHRDRPKRVLLFAKAAPVCPERGDSGRPNCDPVADTSLRGRQRRRVRRRGGMVRAGEQPCTSG